jgi:hypothetical protein
MVAGGNLSRINGGGHHAAVAAVEGDGEEPSGDTFRFAQLPGDS